jgi:magnesium-transporting ATPase (P-type)
MYHRLAYTWIGIVWFSIAFYLFAICVYQALGRFSANQFSGFVDTPNHVMGMRSMSWMLILFVPICATAFDVIFKVFSNMFYPTQTQIHMEMESMSKVHARRRRLAAHRERQANRRARGEQV